MSKQDEGRAQVGDLVVRFQENYAEYIHPGSEYNETELRNDFLTPFLEALGWDVLNKNQALQHLREVVHEDTVQVDEDGQSFDKKPDYAFRQGLERKFFLEAKKPSIPLLTSNESAFQVRRYGWNARMPVSVLSNFDYLIIYDCHSHPQPGDNASVARLKIYRYTEYVDKFDDIYNQLSRDAVYSGSFDETFGKKQPRGGTERFDEYFLRQIERWRIDLAENLVQQNATLDQDEVNFLVQRLINRIIFLRVCEDRNLEKYERLKEVKTYQDLKRLFRKADVRYNSGLFNFAEDELSLNVELGSAVLVEIFKELYFPESPYAFSVVETDVISEIYEIFLSKEVELGVGGKVRVIAKPEVVESSGVVPTPKYIVEAIVQRTLSSLCEGKTPTKLAQLRIADIACGSGTFLLAAYEYLLNFHLEWYLQDGAEKHKHKVYQGSGESWYLTLHEKQRILLNNIYGVDIDLQAVEVTQFSLLLKLLENETAASVTSYMGRYRKAHALPSLSQNIQWGNSLVDNTYRQFDKSFSEHSDAFGKLNPFDWDRNFPQLKLEGGFDAIVGNPPYIRTQHMVSYSPHEVKYYQSKVSPYISAKSDNFDKYALFIERSLLLLKPEGYLGYIVPHKFFTIKSGGALRKLIASQKFLVGIVHFGVQQVFEGQTTTYTCILSLRKKENEQITVEHVSNVKTWRYGKSGTIETLDADTFSEKPWMLSAPEVRALFKRLRQDNPTTLNETSDIFVGLQTSNDKLYIVHPTEEREDTVVFIDIQGVAWAIEKGILRPCLYDALLPAFSRPAPNASIIFPYTITEGKARLYSQNEMQEQFPLCWKYLNAYESALLKRHDPRRLANEWYRYGRSQSLTKFDGEPKIIWSTLSLEARYAYDTRNILFTGGGNGPYYGLKAIPKSPYSLYYFLAILSHPVFDAMVREGTSQFRGGYGSYGKQFIQNIPIRVIDFSQAKDKGLYENIVRRVEKLIEVTDATSSVRIARKKMLLARQAKALKEDIDQLVNQLYGIDDQAMKLVKDSEIVVEEVDEAMNETTRKGSV